MTEPALPPSPTDRITALESGLAHMREFATWRHEATSQRIVDLIAHNKKQDEDALLLATRIGEQIDKINETLWSGLKWLGGTLAATILSVVLKALGLV